MVVVGEGGGGGVCVGGWGGYNELNVEMGLHCFIIVNSFSSIIMQINKTFYIMFYLFYSNDLFTCILLIHRSTTCIFKIQLNYMINYDMFFFKY